MPYFIIIIIINIIVLNNIASIKNHIIEMVVSDMGDIFNYCIICYFKRFLYKYTEIFYKKRL